MKNRIELADGRWLEHGADSRSICMPCPNCRGTGDTVGCYYCDADGVLRRPLKGDIGPLLSEAKARQELSKRLDLCRGELSRAKEMFLVPPGERISGYVGLSLELMIHKLQSEHEDETERVEKELADTRNINRHRLVNVILRSCRADRGKFASDSACEAFQANLLAALDHHWGGCGASEAEQLPSGLPRSAQA